MTGKIEVTPAELNEIVKAQVAAALAAERSPKPIEPETTARQFDEEERARTRAELISQGAEWAAVCDEALEAADRELANPYSTIVHRLSVSLPSSGHSPHQSPPDRLAVAATLLEHKARTDVAFGVAANGWFRLGVADEFRRPASFRALCEQRIRIRGIQAGEADEAASSQESMQENNT